MSFIFTIGYEGKKLDDFISILLEKGIDIIIDVRANPNSRKKGFSKRSLQESLEKEGIQYYSAETLGITKEIRTNIKQSKNFVYALKTETNKIIKKQKTEFEKVKRIMKKNRACLLCFEADPKVCHRTVISGFLRRKIEGAKVVHL